MNFNNEAVPVEKKGRILLVEDEEPLRRFARRVLAAGGYEVVEACDGLQALKLLEGEGAAVDLIISDMVMPGLGGAGLAKEARNRRPGLKIILISGYEDEVAEVLSELGHDASFLHKPFSSTQLLAAI